MLIEIDRKKPKIDYGVVITPNATIIGNVGLRGRVSTTFCHLLGVDPFMASQMVAEGDLTNKKG